jgi:hypothetical protein
VQSRPGPNGSLDRDRLMITGMMIAGLGIPGVGRAAGADSRSRTSWQRWLWPGGIQRLGAGAFPAARLTLMTELDSELGSFNLNLKFKFKLPGPGPGPPGPASRLPPEPPPEPGLAARGPVPVQPGARFP